MSLTHVSSGKVRDIYALDDGNLLFVTSDRMSAFDVVMAEPIPDKGRVLTAITAFWLEHLAGVAKSHLVSLDAPPGSGLDDLAGRTMVVRKADMLPIECIVRGYLSGSAWAEYRRSGTMHGQPLPPGMQQSEQLPEPVFTPSTKAVTGHDENITFEAAVELVGADLAAQAREISLEAYQQGRAWAAERGIIIADTKFELGLIDGRLSHLRRGPHPGLVALLARRRVQAGHVPAGVRQAAAARLAGGHRLGQDTAPAGAARRRGRRHPGALHRRLRAPDREALRRLAGGCLTRFAVLVEVGLRPGIADPQGATIERSLPALGFGGIDTVRTGKAIRFNLDAADEADARRRVDELCQRFLTNPVIETAAVSLEAAT